MQPSHSTARPTPGCFGIAGALAALLLVAALAACGGGGDFDDSPPPPAAATTVTGPEGASIVLPAGALAAPVTVRVARDSQDAPPLPAVATPAGDVYLVSPAGLPLTQRATVQIPLGAGVPAEARFVIAQSNEDGTWTLRADTRRNGSMLEVEAFQLGHFQAVRIVDRPAAAGQGSARVRVASALQEVEEIQLSAPGFVEDAASRSLVNPAIYRTAQTVDVTAASYGPPPYFMCPHATEVVVRPFNAGTGGELALAPQTMRFDGSRQVGPWTVPLSIFRPTRPGGLPEMSALVFVTCQGPTGPAYTLSAAFPLRYRVDNTQGLVFSEQPADQTVNEGGAATFYATVAGGPPAPASGDQYTLEWQRSDDEGATWRTVAAQLQVNGPQHRFVNYALAYSSNGALFQAKACYLGNCLLSRSARVTVVQYISPATIVTQPHAITTQAGETGSFTVAVRGTSVSIEWQLLTPGSPSWRPVGGVPEASWPGALPPPHTPTLITPPGTLAQDGWLFRAVARGPNSIAVSEPALWRVAGAALVPTIVTQPVSTSVPLGATAQFAVAVDGTAPLSYQWSRDGEPVAGATSPVLSLVDVTSAALGDYRLTVSGPGGSVTSDAATLGLSAGPPPPIVPAFTLQPAARTSVPGGTATFSAAVTGSPVPQCQWTRNGIALPGATTCTAYTTPATTPADNGAVYNVVAYNTAGAAFGNGAVLTVSSPVGGVLALLAGSLADAGSADGAAADARFDFPYGVAIDSRGNTYVVDCNSHTIRKITPAGVVSTLAGSPGLSGSADGIGAAARFNSPIGVAVDASFNVYVADNNNHTIRKITADGVVTTLAGTAPSGGHADGLGAAARFENPYALALDPAGNLYVADTYARMVRKITPDGTVSTIAGIYGSEGSNDGPGATATFSRVFSIAVDSLGNLYVADRDNHSIRKITPAGVVSTFAGSSGTSGSADGTGAEARFQTPQAVVVDASDNLYVGDFGNHTIRKITPAGVVTTVLGVAGQQGVQLGTDPRLDSPRTLAIAGKTMALSAGNAVLSYVLP